MRIPVGKTGAQTANVQQFHNTLIAALLVRNNPMHTHRLCQNFTDLHPRVQRTERVLEDHLHILTVFAHLCLIEGSNVIAIKLDRSRCDLFKLQNAAASRSLAAARFTNQSQGFTLVHGKGNTVDRFHLCNFALDDDAFGNRKVHPQVIHLQEVRLLRGTRSRRRFFYRAHDASLVGLSKLSLLKQAA